MFECYKPKASKKIFPDDLRFLITIEKSPSRNSIVISDDRIIMENFPFSERNLLFVEQDDRDLPKMLYCTLSQHNNLTTKNSALLNHPIIKLNIIEDCNL